MFVYMFSGLVKKGGIIMAKPRVFISSTYYDLKHLRSSLENFVDSLGFEPVLSEKGDIAYSPDIPLDESCYREAMNADIFVLIIGGRYGSEASSGEKKPDKAFFDRYDSITKMEYRNAISNNVPNYILIDSNVYAEYRTFLNNKNNKGIKYVYVDSVNVYYLIEEILSQHLNNPMFPFDKFSDIVDWLREQWAGLFRELLKKLSQQQQIATLTSKVEELGEINQTLRRYMETIMSKVSPDESKEIMDEETKRLREAQIEKELKDNAFFILMINLGFRFDEARNAIEKSNSIANFYRQIMKKTPGSIIIKLLTDNEAAQKDFNKVRTILGKPPFDSFDDIKDSNQD